MKNTFLVEVSIDAGGGVPLPNSTARQIIRNTIKSIIKDTDLVGHYPHGITLDVEEINLKEPERKYERTPNPYTSDTNSALWDAGYKAGSKDADQAVADVHNRGKSEGYDVGFAVGEAEHDNLKSTRIRDLERQVTNLQEKNDSQRDIIVEASNEARTTREVVLELQEKNDSQREIIIEAGEQHDIDAIQLEQLKKLVNDMGKNYKAGHAAGLRAGQDIADSVLTAKGETAFNEGFAAGQRSLEGLGSVGYDTGKIEGFESGHREGYDKGLAQGLEAPMEDTNQYKLGYEEGRQRALEDWIMHFILYMQENEQSFAVVKLSHLETMRQSVSRMYSRAPASGLRDEIDKIDAILSRLEHL